MRAALRTKLQASRPAESVAAELERLQLWLPMELQPLLRDLRSTIARFGAEPDARLRLNLEREALERLPAKVGNLPERKMILAFIEEVKKAVEESRAARTAALQGVEVGADFDDRLVSGMHVWLEGQHKHPEIAASLARLLTFWHPHNVA